MLASGVGTGVPSFEKVPVVWRGRKKYPAWERCFPSGVYIWEVFAHVRRLVWYINGAMHGKSDRGVNIISVTAR